MLWELSQSVERVPGIWEIGIWHLGPGTLSLLLDLLF